MAIYRIIERCGWWPQGIKEWVEKTFPGAKILDWEDKTFQCEGYYGYSRSGHREVIFECSENIIPGHTGPVGNYTNYSPRVGIQGRYSLNIGSIKILEMRCYTN